MNPRIKELALQAEEVVFSSPSTGRTTKELNLEKFAELIIRECLDCIAKVHKTEYTKEFNEGYTLGVERCFYKIEDHFFGVEE